MCIFFKIKFTRIFRSFAFNPTYNMVKPKDNTDVEQTTKNPIQSSVIYALTTKGGTAPKATVSIPFSIVYFK